MKRTIPLGFAALTVALCIGPLPQPSVAISADETVPVDRESKEPAELTKVILGSTRPVHRAGNILLAGQPEPADFEQLAKEGYATVITLRGPDENVWDEAEVVESAGMRFVELPIVGPDDLDDQLFQRCFELLREADPAKRVCLHCASANRVGAVWLAYRVVECGIPVSEAREEAAKVGLRSPVLEQRAMQYLQDRSGQ